MFVKYPRTPHLEGSRLQPGDSDHDQVSMASLTTGELVWEEKIDGANSGISFDESGNLQIQSRGHYLTGGAREAQFNLLKTWATGLHDDLYIVLGDRYIMYGEWCYAKHSVFYDLLPHYFLEFDVYDRSTGDWLSTDARHRLLADLPVTSVPVVHRGHLRDRKAIERMLAPSLYKSPDWRSSMAAQAARHGIDPDRAIRETDGSDLSEGFYLKQEADGKVVGRYKFVRHGFVQTILDSGTHWADRPILPNMLSPSADLFGRGQ
jgi:hypothetical protein